MTTDSLLGNRHNVISLRCWRECQNEDATVGAESRMLDMANVMSEHKVATGDNNHTLSLLVDHVSVASNLGE